MKIVQLKRKAFLICAVYPPASEEVQKIRQYAHYNCDEETFKLHDRTGQENFQMTARCFVSVSKEINQAMDQVRQYFHEAHKMDPEFLRELELDEEKLDPQVLPDEKRPYEYDFIRYLDPLFQLEYSSFGKLEGFYNLCRELYCK